MPVNAIKTDLVDFQLSPADMPAQLMAYSQRLLSDPRKRWEQTVYLSALRLSDGELLIIATDNLMADPIGLYGKRWEIETLFGCLKSKGFNLKTLTSSIRPHQ